MEGGNPQIAEYGKQTQFGSEGGPDPVEAGRKGGYSKGSIRQSLRRIGAHEFEVGEDAPDFTQQMMKVFGGEKRMTGSQLAAVKKFGQAMKNPKAMDTLIDNIDGKLVQKQVETKVSLEDLVNGSYDIPGDTESTS